MLFRELRGQPNNRHRLQPGRVRHELPQVRVIGALKLVLDQHPVICCRILAENIRPEWADILLLCLKFKLDAERVTQNGKVFSFGKSGREAGGLACVFQ